TLDLEGDDQSSTVLALHFESRAATRTNGGIAFLDDLLDILRVDLATANDDDVLQATGDEQLSIVKKSEVAGPEKWAVAIVGTCTERLLRVVGLAPVSSGDARTRHPYLADDIGRARLPGLRVGDDHARGSARPAGRHEHFVPCS